jgi:hypothetical protein
MLSRGFSTGGRPIEQMPTGPACDGGLCGHLTSYILILFIISHYYHYCYTIDFNRKDIMARMQAQADFQLALSGFGFSQPAMLAIVANGLTNSQDLVGIKNKDIENIMKIIRASMVPPMLVPYMAQKCLNILCYWVNHRHRLMESIDINEFTPEAADAFGRLMTFEA